MANNRNESTFHNNRKSSDDFKERRNDAKKNFNKKDFLIDSLDHESIDVIKEFMQYHVKDITSSQLRNVYSVIIEKPEKLGFAVKRVKIAYVAARNNNPGMHALLDKLDDMLSKNAKFDIIRNFAEACVAYHKYFETLKK
jgi:CRISPR type III-A-associated protein Csm2